MSVLAVDLGGTKVSLARAEANDGTIELLDQRRYRSSKFDDFESVVRRYLDDSKAAAGDFAGASVAVAGPVIGRSCQTTNLPWAVDADVLERELGLAKAILLNDLEALAWAVPVLQDEQCALIHPGGGPADANACVVAAGTGLGQAGLLWHGGRHLPFASEAGHMSFGPNDARERALLEFLSRSYSHVSWERVASGMALPGLYDFVIDYRDAKPAEWVEAARADGSLAARIAAEAEAETCPLCFETMELFATLLGRAVGNAALAYMARGGVFLAGGVVQRNRVLLEREAFMVGYLARGRMRPLVEAMPVKLILEPEAGLIGAYRAFAG